MNKRPTPETDAEEAIDNGDTKPLFEFCRKLERERDEALAKLSQVHQWIERNHADGFIDSQTHLQNLERVTDSWHEKLDAREKLLAAANRGARINAHINQRLAAKLNQLQDDIDMLKTTTKTEPK